MRLPDRPVIAHSQVDADRPVLSSVYPCLVGLSLLHRGLLNGRVGLPLRSRVFDHSTYARLPLPDDTLTSTFWLPENWPGVCMVRADILVPPMRDPLQYAVNEGERC